MYLAGLHGHQEYSLLDGAGTAIQHAEAARDAGYIALALTDHCTLAGSLHHMTACQNVGITSISGCEVYYRPNRKIQGQKEWLKNYNHLTLLAKDLVGWHSLMRIVSEAHRSGFYGRAAVDDELLEKHCEGLICLTGCLGGRLARSIVAQDDRQAESWIRQLKRIFKDNLFIEIMPHDIDDQKIANVESVRIAQRHGIGVVTTIDSHYPWKEWAPTQDVLLMIATNQTLKKREKKRDEGEDVYEFTVKTLYHLTSDQITAMYSHFHPGLSAQIIEESMKNTLYVAALTTPFSVDKTEKMPVVSFPGEDDNAVFLRRLALEGLAKRGYIHDQKYVDQVEFEMQTFIKLNSVEQMLMAWDVIDWAKSDRPVPKRDKKTDKLIYIGKKKPMMVGPSRGSAAGSTIAWAVGITNVNPIRYRLLFERFLNPERVDKPDIDIDFSPTDVDLVEDYVKAVHGKDRVVDIIAHSTFGPRAALTDVGRVLCVPYDHVKSATKSIDDKERGKLTELRVLYPTIERYASEYPMAWEESCRIQGMVARKSEHAGGVLILPGPVEEYIPVERTGGQKGKLLSAYGERAGAGNQLISDYGYNKLDILRVAELTKQQKAVDLYEERTGERIDLDALAVHDDPYATEPEVMDIFKQGYLVGVFQFSATAAKLTRRLQPDSIFDLASINALIRPGPRGAGMDESFVERKHEREERSIWHPVLEPYLDYTQNLMVFQEQLIEVVHRLGGISKAQADIFRKIASKLYRDPEYARATMGKWYVPIRDGFMKAGITEEIFGKSGIDGEQPTGIWSQFLSFSDYSFNLSHAVGYSLLAYRDAWLKYHIPREFYAAFLSVGLSAVIKKKVLQKAEAIREARHRGWKIMPPDINESGRDYTVVDDGIRLGLEAIRHIGPRTACALEEHRPFESMDDFERRVPRGAVNITARAALIMSGACDRWGKRDQFTEEYIDEIERDLLGMSLTSTYSIAVYADVIEGRFWTEPEFDSAGDGTRVAVVGEVAGVKEWNDKKGNRMCFIDLVYGPNQYSCTVFASLYEVYKDLIQSGRPLLVTGAKNTYKGRAGIRVESLPVYNEDEWVAPIMDLATFVEKFGDQEEQLANDSVYPEDLQESLEPDSSRPFAAAV
jgi:DNA polymerase-3 subunit alpha